MSGSDRMRFSSEASSQSGLAKLLKSVEPLLTEAGYTRLAQFADVSEHPGCCVAQSSRQRPSGAIAAH